MISSWAIYNPKNWYPKVYMFVVSEKQLYFLMYRLYFLLTNYTCKYSWNMSIWWWYIHHDIYTYAENIYVSCKCEECTQYTYLFNTALWVFGVDISIQ